MDEKQNAFQINREDNVATALTPLVPGPVELRGDACAPEVEAATEVPMGHKIALRDIRNVVGTAVKTQQFHIGTAAFGYDLLRHKLGTLDRVDHQHPVTDALSAVFAGVAGPGEALQFIPIH